MHRAGARCKGRLREPIIKAQAAQPVADLSGMVCDQTFALSGAWVAGFRPARFVIKWKC
jgi:hypothetical protein